MKQARITPVLKRDFKNTNDPAAYRLISNVSTLAKILERIVARQLQHHVDEFNLLPPEQSSFRKFHSTETALIKTVSDVLDGFDNGLLSLLAFLDLSAAFDSIDHKILLTRLQYSCGLSDTVLRWFDSFLSSRSMSFKDNVSYLTDRGVPQGSVLGPLLFVIYFSEISNCVHQHNLNVHLYTDDVLIYGPCPSSDVKCTELSARLSSCIDSIHSWLSSNRLLLNTNKTKVMWCASSRRRNCLPSLPVRVGTTR